MLGSGITMSFIGLGINADSWGDPDKGVGLINAGGVVALTSIPLFIGASKNKKRAKLALKGESISFKYFPIEKSNYVALSLTIPLGK